MRRNRKFAGLVEVMQRRNSVEPEKAIVKVLGRRYSDGVRLLMLENSTRQYYPIW